MRWLMAYMALVLAILKVLAILLSGNIAESFSFKSLFAWTESPPKTDFSVHNISVFIQSALRKCSFNVFWLCSFETIVSPLDSVDSPVEGFDFALKKFFFCTLLLFSFSMISQCCNAERPLHDNSIVLWQLVHLALVLPLSLDNDPWNAGSRSHPSTKNLRFFDSLFFSALLFILIYYKKEKYSRLLATQLLSLSTF